MAKLDIEKEYEAIKAIEDAIKYNNLDEKDAFDYVETWEAAKDILVYLKVRGFEVVKRGSTN